MVAFATADVVFVVGIDEVVDLAVVVDAALDEFEGVLPNHGVVLAAVDYEEVSVEVFGFVEEAVGGIAVGVLLWGVHIALAVHDFVPFPVDDGAAGAAHFEVSW